MQRCIGITNSKKRCRRQLDDHDKWFCCEDHIPYNFEKKINRNYECPVCLDTINLRTNIKILKCNHAICRTCWENHKTTNLNCPICRNQVNKLNN